MWIPIPIDLPFTIVIATDRGCSFVFCKTRNAFLRKMAHWIFGLESCSFFLSYGRASNILFIFLKNYAPLIRE